jgi:hypothetical protein
VGQKVRPQNDVIYKQRPQANTQISKSGKSASTDHTALGKSASTDGTERKRSALKEIFAPQKISILLPYSGRKTPEK